VDVVRIDDGRQPVVGDWLTPSERFPGGMADLAGQIRDSGFRAGLWLAPFLLHENSQALAEHPDIALRSRDGAIAWAETELGRCAVLDCTNPGAEAWLREVITTVVDEWGYSYLELDHLAYAVVSSEVAAYHRPATTGPANLRRGLEIARQAAGDGTFILANNCDFGPAIGLIDAMRVGPDVGPIWLDGAEPSVASAARATLQRNWMHRRWWVNDPGSLLTRQSNTALNDAEVRFLATATGLAGGQVMLGDAVLSLTPEQSAVARALMPPAGVAARPLDATAPVPSVWRTELGEGHALLAILNWSDSRTWVSPTPWLRPGETAFNFWDERLATGDVLLEPHDAALWQVSAPGRGPRVIGDTGHIAMHGLDIRHVSGQVHVRNDAAVPRVVAIDVKGTVQFAELAPGELARFW
jgi:alpha-galactosidase